MQRYIDFIKTKHSSNVNASNVIIILECLERVAMEIDYFAEQAVAIHEYPDIATAKQRLLALIEEMKNCFDMLMSNNQPLVTDRILKCFRPLTAKGIKQSVQPALDYFHFLWQDDYYLKSVRADERCFAREFISSVTQGPGKEDKLTLRPGPRKKYTVKGTGVTELTGRTPQYPPDEKRHYSQHQSVSFIFGLHHPLLFDHGKERQETSVAFMLHEAKPNRYLVHDGGTVKRPYDFFDPTAAQKYYDRKVLGQRSAGKSPVDPVLFADKESFKQALIQTQHRGKYNEVLARLKWDKARDKIAIGNDNLSSRCTAQDYARLMREALKEKAAASGEAWDDTYQVPICYYLPGQEKHLQAYTVAEQAQDCQEALALFQDGKRFAEKETKYDECKFEFFLCLNDQRNIHAVLQDQFLLFRILTSGKVHIVLSLLEKANPAILDRIRFDKTDSIVAFSAEVIYQMARVNNRYLWAWLKESGVDVNIANSDGFTALHLAARNNTVTAMKLIILGADVNQVDKLGCTPLYWAAMCGHEVIMQAFIAARADINKATEDGFTPLRAAAQGGHLPVVEFLLAARAEKEKSGYDDATPLIIAAEKGHITVVKALLAAGAEKDKAMNDDCTPLIIAAQNGYLPVVEALLVAGAEKNKATKDGCTPLFVAAKNGHLPVVRALLTAGAEKDKATKDGYAPLYAAALLGHLPVVEALLAAGAEKDKITKDGFTPLFLAAQQGHLTIVEALLAAGAATDILWKPRMPLQKGRTPLQIAKENGHTAIVAAISKHILHQLKTKGPSAEEINKALSLFGFFAPSAQVIAEKTLRVKAAAQALEDVILRDADKSCLQRYKEELTRFPSLQEVVSHFQIRY